MEEQNYSEEYTEEIAKQESIEEENDDFSETPPSDIVAFNELRSCADLVRMYKSNQLIIKPDFQRDVVWSKPSQTRFIDSLVKQLPIPSMCLSLDYKTNERLMIDGLQRISSIINFLNDDSWKLSSLEDIDQRISGKTVEVIKEKYDDIYSRLENLTIPVTVLRCDYSKKSHMHYLFTIFHRLNTGGNKLSNQEIRNCIFQGSFNHLLKNAVTYGNFRRLLDLEEGKTYRFAYEEIILRFFSFEERYEEYNGKLAKFLNDYMDDNKSLNDASISAKRHLFERTIDILFLKAFDSKPMPKLSKATTEGLMVGIARNLDTLEQLSSTEVKQKVQNLRNDELYSIDNLKEGLSGKEKVKNRLAKSIEIFA